MDDRRIRLTQLVLVWALAGLAGCVSKMPDKLPPLSDMIEPLNLFDEPDDEGLRKDLPLGGFTGVYVGDARNSLDAMLGESEGVEIVRIVENSPADLARLRVGDLLLEASSGDGPAKKLRFPSEWRAVELAAKPGTKLTVVFDRANRRSQTTVDVVPRAHLPERKQVQRFREEKRVGVVFRTATEVEARAAGLGPGGGAVIVGMSRRSPWRSAGLAFGDLIVSAGGKEVAHPGVILDAIRAAGESMPIKIIRDGKPVEFEARLTRRATELQTISVQPLFSYESERGRTDWSFLLGLFGYESTAAAWRFQFLWFFGFGGGDKDELLEVSK